jgi:hypothetical protein
VNSVATLNVRHSIYSAASDRTHTIRQNLRRAHHGFTHDDAADQVTLFLASIVVHHRHRIKTGLWLVARDYAFKKLTSARDFYEYRGGLPGTAPGFVSRE